MHINTYTQAYTNAFPCALGVEPKLSCKCMHAKYTSPTIVRHTKITTNE